MGWNKNGVGQQFPIYTPGSVLTPGGFATMGFGPPAAIGAKIASPDRTVVRRSWVMADSARTLPRSRRRVENGLAIIWLVMNNNAYGTIAGLQKAAYGLTHGTLFPAAKVGWDAQKPNYAEIARAYGCEAERLTSAADLASRAQARAGRRPALSTRRPDEEQPDADHRATGTSSTSTRRTRSSSTRRRTDVTTNRDILVSEVRAA